MKNSIVIFLFVFILISCNNSDGDIGKEIVPILWETITIESKGQTIIIDKYEEYGIRDTCDFDTIRINDSFTEYKPISRGREYFYINHQERDSLFKYVYDIVANPIYTEQLVSCYVGNISIGFSTVNTTLICKYHQVGNWTKISPSTSKLFHLLKTKTTISLY